MPHKEVRPNTIPDPEGDKAFLENAIGAATVAPHILGLSAHIEKEFSRNQDDFKSERMNMLRLLLRVKGEYDADKLRDIKTFGGDETYLRSGETKCRAAESWIKDIYGTGQDMFSVEPTAIPELPDEDYNDLIAQVQRQGLELQLRLKQAGQALPPEYITELLDKHYEQQLDQAKKDLNKDAKKRCARASKLIKDQNQQGGWAGTFNDFLYNFTRLSFGIIKGPVLVKAKRHKWVMGANGIAEFTTVDELVTKTYSVDPFNFFPSKGMKEINDGSTIEVHTMSEQGLANLIGTPSYDDEQIKLLIDSLKGGATKKKWFVVDNEVAIRNAQKINPEKKSVDVDADNEKGDLIYVQEFYGPVTGKMLLDWGIERTLPPEQKGSIDQHTIYQANCWKVGKFIIKAVINPDALGRKPYHISSWSKNPDTLIGEGLIAYGAPVEDALNGVVRALKNNIAIASGPMAEVDTDRVDLDTPMHPWRTIKSSSRRMKSSGPAVTYYQPQMHVAELVAAFQFFSKLLDEMTVPAYAQGASQSGVTAGTATVFTQLLAAASRSIKAVVANIDNDIIKPYIQMSYDYQMRLTTDETAKGDANIVAGGVGALKQKEQQAQRKVEFLQITANPVLQQILGQENLGAMMSQIATANDIDLPDKDRLDGTVDMQAILDTMLSSQSGVDPMQENGQMGAGGGAMRNAQVTTPSGAPAGVAQ